jgi:hypothetical protein
MSLQQYFQNTATLYKSKAPLNHKNATTLFGLPRRQNSIPESENDSKNMGIAYGI